MTAREKPDQGAMTGLAELLAHALAIETDASERYTMLADQMAVHHNSELAELFRKLASFEDLHAREIIDKAKQLDLPKLKLDDLKWTGDDSPEAVDAAGGHYLMTPWHALQMALEAELRALDFFAQIAADTQDDEIRRWAKEFEEEEAEHVRLVERYLAEYPKPKDDWADDMDPPAPPD